MTDANTTETTRPITGQVSFTIGGATKRSKFKPLAVVIDFDKLPDVSRAFLLHYGIRQYLADGAAGAGDQAEFESGITERADKVRDADFTRTRGEGLGRPDTAETRALKLAKAAIRAKVKAMNAKPLDADKMTAMATALVASNPDYMKDAKAQIAAEAKLAESGVGDDIMADIMAALGGNATAEVEGEEAPADAE